MAPLLYKIVPRAAWSQIETSGVFAGAGIDLADGFIHLSTGEQAQRTADLYFAGQSDLLLVAVRTHSLGDLLRWELPRPGADAAGRRDQQFPHYYGKIAPDQVAWVKPIQQDHNGRHVIKVDNT